ncbi:MAG TPA: hypothetical protein H9867_08590, partial [Candidatus Corynebacterium gallistercoris]|nr:hypothetical protein [Candidatus Corynebacterium gallistercoris]
MINLGYLSTFVLVDGELRARCRVLTEQAGQMTTAGEAVSRVPVPFLTGEAFPAALEGLVRHCGESALGHAAQLGATADSILEYAD